MKKTMIAFLLAAVGFLLPAQSDDFFSDSNDSVLERARQKYEQRQEKPNSAKEVLEAAEEDEEAEVQANEPASPEEDADAVVQDDAGDDEIIDIQTSGDPNEPDFRIEISRRPFGPIMSRNFILFINFFGLGDLFGWDDDDDRGVRKPKKPAVREEAPEKEGLFASFPLVVSFVPGISFPPGVRDTNFAFGAVGSSMRNVTGLSASGVFDIIEEDLFGFQSAGVFAMAGGDVRGGQFSGVFNIGAGDFRGIQAAGVFNVAGDVLGVQSAGVFDIANNVKGGQFSGVFNISGDIEGIQAAGAFNIAEDVKGVQAAGAVNAAHNVRGIQMAGAVNVANDVRGTQIGVVNIAENLYGIPIGLVNITKNGIRDVGFWHDEAGNLFGYAANGTNNFYTILFAGESFDAIGDNWDTFAAGAGLGYRTAIGPLHLDTDVSAKAFFGDSWRAMLVDLQNGWPVAYENYMNRGWKPWPYGTFAVFPMVRMSIGLPVFKVIDVFGGVTLDIGIDGTYPVPEILRAGQVHSFDVFGTSVDIYPRFFWGMSL